MSCQHGCLTLLVSFFITRRSRRARLRSRLHSISRRGNLESDFDDEDTTFLCSPPHYYDEQNVRGEMMQEESKT